MGWAQRSNPLRDQKIADSALIRQFLRRHPDQLAPLMKATAEQSWLEVQAWMASLDFEAVRGA